MSAWLSKLKPKRRWSQFSLRAFLVLMTVVAVWFGWAMNNAREQRTAVAWVEELGGRVQYGFQRKGAETPGPKWVRDILGIDFMDAVAWLDLRDTQVSDLTSLAGLKNLQELYFGGTQVTDLTPLAGLKNLQVLYLGGTQVTDLTPLAGLKNLQVLYLNGTPASDVTPLAGLKNLQELYLDGTPVSDVTLLAGLENLQALSIGHTQVSDLTPLAGLKKLESLYLYGTPVSDVTPLAGLKNLQGLYLSYRDTQVSEEQLTSLKQALPDCEIYWWPSE